MHRPAGHRKVADRKADAMKASFWSNLLHVPDHRGGWMFSIAGKGFWPE